jgi:hypothetical protein
LPRRTVGPRRFAVGGVPGGGFENFINVGELSANWIQLFNGKDFSNWDKWLAPKKTQEAPS